MGEYQLGGEVKRICIGINTVRKGVLIDGVVDLGIEGAVSLGEVRLGLGLTLIHGGLQLLLGSRNGRRNLLGGLTRSSTLLLVILEEVGEVTIGKRMLGWSLI